MSGPRVTGSVAIYCRRDAAIEDVARRLGGYAGDYDIDAIVDELEDPERAEGRLVAVRVPGVAAFMDIAARHSRDAVPGCRP